MRNILKIVGVSLTGLFVLSCETPTNQHSRFDTNAETRSDVDLLLTASQQARSRGFFSSELKDLVESFSSGNLSAEDSARVSSDLARSNLHLNKMDDARSSSLNAINAAKQSKNMALISDAYYVSTMAHSEDDIELARKHADLAIEYAGLSKDMRMHIQSYWGLGSLEEALNDRDAALAAFSTAIEMANNHDMVTEAYVESLFHAGHMLDQAGKHEKAVGYYEQAGRAAREVPVSRLFAFGPYHQGRIYHDRLKQGANAIESLNRALLILEAQDLTSYFLYAIALQRRGDIYLDLIDDPEMAASSYRDSRRAAEENGHQRFVPRAMAYGK